MNSMQTFSNSKTITIDSREVAEWAGKEHGHLCRDIRGYVEHLNESNFGLVDFFIPSTYTDAKGEERPNYLITRKGCEMVANKMTGQKGVIFTARYIERFHEYEDAIKLILPQDYPSALRALAASFEEQQKLEASNRAMLPKADYYDALVAREHLTNFRDTAKLLQMPERAFVNSLLERGFLYRDQKGKLRPYAAKNNGYFEVKEYLNETTGATGVQTLVTVRGRERFSHIFETPPQAV